jgi:hypothetical protein
MTQRTTYARRPQSHLRSVVKQAQLEPDLIPSRGFPLDQSTQEVMERRFGHRFGNVRVHTDEEPAQAARAP